MSQELKFKGFSKETVDFFNNLKRNNNKKWFDNRRKEYETFVLHPAKEFVAAMGAKLKDCELGGKHYKRIPGGYDSSHPNAELLLHNGLYAGCEIDIPDELYSDRLINYCWKRFYSLDPLHKWLVSIKIGEL